MSVHHVIHQHGTLERTGSSLVDWYIRCCFHGHGKSPKMFKFHTNSKEFLYPNKYASFNVDGIYKFTLKLFLTSLFVFLSFSFSKLEDKRLTCRLTEPCWHSFLDITWHENYINNNTKACISGFYGMYFFIPYLLIYLILFCFLYLFFYSFNCWPLILILLLHLVLKFLCINT